MNKRSIIYFKRGDNMNKRITVFVSYSWDSIDHKAWVRKLVDDLNNIGIQATMDNLETEQNTVHLNEMMASSIQKNDYTLIVMTPDYAFRADNGQGGVGTETRYIMNLMDDNKNRVIPLIRNGEDSRAIPFYLQQINYIDFRENLKYEESFTDLLKRMRFETSEKYLLSGSNSTLKDFDVEFSNRTSRNVTSSRTIPNLRKITELDKNKFIRETFDYLKDELKDSLEQTKQINDNFDFEFEEVGPTKILLNLYVDGYSKVHYKIWVGSLMSSTNSIYLSHGRMSMGNDNSFNEVIQVIEDDGTLKLQRTMNIFGNRASLTRDGLVDSIWQEIVGKLKLL